MAVGDRNIDRALCIALGFSVIIVGAGLYLRYTRNVPAREGNVNVREIIRQQFTLLKVRVLSGFSNCQFPWLINLDECEQAGSFFFVEIVFFPAMCGLLLNLATLPSIPGATIALRTAYYMEFPVSAWFLTWLAGTNFMFSFAQAISIVRKCIRKGVLYFIRDPSDPNVSLLAILTMF